MADEPWRELLDKQACVELVYRLARIPVLSGLMAQATPKAMIRANLQQVIKDRSKVTPDLVEQFRHFRAP